jgi:hypothetical protein
MATMWVRHWPYAVKLGVLALGVALAACSDEGNPVDPRGPAREPRPTDEGYETSMPAVVPRVELDFEVNGAFQPGVPIVITVVAKGRRQTDEMKLGIAVHDELIPRDTPPERAGWRPVGSMQGGVPRGAERRLAQTITIAQPGYYRVVAHAVTSGPQPEVAPGDSLILDVSDETLYILVDEKGGRVTDGYDHAVLGGRQPMFGSFGPFTGEGGGAPSVSLSGGPARQTSTSYSYYLEYYNQNVGAYSRVVGASAVIDCLTTSQTVYSSTTYPLDANGSFTFTCAYGYFRGQILLQDLYSNVLNRNRQSGGVVFFNQSIVGQRLVANSDYAAHVFTTLHTYVPVVESRFGGRWRDVLHVVVTDTVQPRHTTYPYPIKDTVFTRNDRVFYEGGLFTTVHEYGHAYQYGAIEPPPVTSAQVCAVHSTNGPSNLQCAFVEGFATFLAVWVTGNELTNAPEYYTTDFDIETQTFYTYSEGLIIEGSVAGFLYDLVDGSGQRDNSSNSAPYEETWDTAVYPGWVIGDLMEACVLHQGSTLTERLSGADQLIYCLEGNVTAETYSPLWRKDWDSVTRNTTLPSGYNSALVRTLWRRNLYGVS